MVTSMGLIAGLDAAHASRASVVAALLIAAIADNLTDSFSIHIYQESEHLPQREVFKGTLTNFAARLLVCLSFVLIVSVLSSHIALATTVAWGLAVLVSLTCLLARERGADMLSEVLKHVFMAGVVLLVSNRVGTWMASQFTA